MWLTKTWVLLAAICSWPGADSQSCSYHYVESFVSSDACEAAVPTLREMLRAVKANDVPFRVHADCMSVVPPREV